MSIDVSIGSLPNSWYSRVPVAPASAGLNGRLRAVAAWLSRPRRVVALLTLIWALNVADLFYTITEQRQKLFRELNPVAVHLMDNHPAGLILYKFTLVAFGSAILIAHRRERVAELSCWFLLAVYGYVGIRWAIYYDHLAIAMTDPAVVLVDPSAQFDDSLSREFHLP